MQNNSLLIYFQNKMKNLMTIFEALLVTSFILTSCGGDNKNSQLKSKDSISNAVNSDNTIKKELSRKKNTLIKLVGEHKLNSISDRKSVV